MPSDSTSNSDAGDTSCSDDDGCSVSDRTSEAATATSGSSSSDGDSSAIGDDGDSQASDDRSSGSDGDSQASDETEKTAKVRPGGSAPHSDGDEFWKQHLGKHGPKHGCPRCVWMRCRSRWLRLEALQYVDQGGDKACLRWSPVE